MAKTIQFNTKRLYTASGQRIIATLHDDNVVTFHDVDRMVSGEYAFDPEYDMLDQKALMQVYDHNQYQSTARAHRDAFYADSVNGSHNLKGRK